MAGSQEIAKVAVGAFGPVTVRATVSDGTVYERDMSLGDVWTLEHTGLFAGYPGTATYEIRGPDGASVKLISTDLDVFQNAVYMLLDVFPRVPIVGAIITSQFHATVAASSRIDGQHYGNNEVGYALDPQPTASFGMSFTDASGVSVGDSLGGFSAALLMQNFDNGIAGKTFTVPPGSVDFRITPDYRVNELPVVPGAAHTEIGAQPLHGTLTLDGEDYLYTPDSGYMGSDTISTNATLVGSSLNYTLGDVLISIPPQAPSVAPDEHITISSDSPPVTVTPVIVNDGSPVIADSLSIDTPPKYGTASVDGLGLIYTPGQDRYRKDSFTYYASVYGVNSNIASVNVDVAMSYNCDCDGDNTNRTLAELRTSLARRLGFSAQATNLPPGMSELLDSFLQDAQRSLYRRYDVLDTERFFTWNMSAGVRFYDVDKNDDTCTKRVDVRKLTWVGVSRDGEAWTPLHCGIDPVRYSMASLQGRPDSYEVRQCIEVWPAPDDDNYKLRIKGHFGLQPFVADTDQTTIDDSLVFLLALSNAKAHYGQPDAGNYIAQMETMLQNLVAGAHETRRYIPGRADDCDRVYVRPKPTEPFA